MSPKTFSEVPDMHPHFDGHRTVPDPPDKGWRRDWCGQELRRYDYSGNRLYGKPKKVKLKPVTKIKLQSSSELDKTAFYKLSKEEIAALPPTSWWTPGLPPTARQDWIAWALDRKSVLGLTYERLYEQVAVQKANGIYSKKDLDRLNLLLERLVPGKSVSTILNR